MNPVPEWIFYEEDSAWIYYTEDGPQVSLLVLKVPGPNYPDVVVFQAIDDGGQRISLLAHKSLLDAQDEALAWLEEQQ